MPTNVAPVSTDQRYCKLGDRGVEVERWQYFLRGTPDVFPRPPLSGVFEMMTKQATESFQKKVAVSAPPSPAAAVRIPWQLNTWWILAPPAPRMAPKTGWLDRETVDAAVLRGYVLPSATYDGMIYSAKFPGAPRTLTSPSHKWRTDTFGSFAFKSAPAGGDKEAIAITDDWEKKNIVTVPIPQLRPLGVRRMRFHKDGADRLVKLFQSWERAKLLHLILTFAGAFVPRYQRGAAPKPGEAEDATKLSNHAWGTAFDINATWNQLHHTPATLPDIGCVRELAQIAAASGFYWGGHYSSRKDGMHFEIGTPTN